MKSVGSIAVIGSLNIDIVNHVSKRPHPGETVKALSTSYFPGGKGANQAVAASLTGGHVKMIGVVGTDMYSATLIESLNESGVNTENVLIKESGTGVAFITVDESGENTIIISEGANGLLSEQDIESTPSVFEDINIVLVQNEISWRTTSFVMKTASEKGIPVIFNPAPAIRSNEILPIVDVLILNMTELEVLLGTSINDRSRAESALKEIVTSGVQEVILTLGEKGSIYMNNEGKQIFTPAYKVKAIDTTAAGDTFIGAFASTYLLDEPIEEKLRFSTAAAALTVSRKGAQTSIPKRDEIEYFLSQQIEQ
jgi:ribokinase